MNIIEKAVRFEGKYEGERTEERNLHSYSVISYIKKGAIKLHTNNQVYELKENSIYFLSPLEEYSLQYSDLNLEFVTLYLNLFDWEALHTIPLLSLIMKNKPDHFHPIFENVNDNFYDIFIHCFLESEAHSSCPYQNKRMAYLISDLLILLYRQFPDTFQQLQGNDRLMEIQRYLEEHYNEKIKISQLSNYFHMNQYYFSHSFKSFSGYSPKQYLTKVQFIHVFEMLIYSDLSIGEIAEHTGFESTNDLSRKFKLLFSLSPSDFRKKLN